MDFDLNTMDEGQFPIRQWPEIHRSRRPYRIEPVIIPFPWVRDHQHASQKSELNAANSLPRRFLLEPIGDHLLHLRAGDEISFGSFARRFGIGEFIDWVLDAPQRAWLEIGERYESGVREFSAEDIKAAWCDPDSVATFQMAKTALAEAYKRADQIPSGTELFTEVMAMGWEQSAFGIELEFDPGTRWVFERPRHIFARAWFELVDSIGAGRIPRECPVCGSRFTPKRSNQTFDTADCRNADYNRRVRKQEWYLNKDRMRKRRERGRITEAEYQQWLNDHPRPTDQPPKEV